MDVDVRFLGNSQLFVDGRKINISQNKVKAILFYILYKMQVTRDEIVSIFWDEFCEEDAKNNLRNVLYKIRRNVDENIIITSGNNNIYVNQQIRIHRDIDIFMDENNEDELRLINEFDFLPDLKIRECSEFENWVTTVGSAYQRMLLNRFLSELEKNLLSNKIENIFNYANKILKIDPFNENACNGLLITLYNQGRFNEAIKLFSEYQTLLKDELGIEAGQKTKNLYGQIIEAKKFYHDDKREKVLFHAHKEIEDKIISEIDNFQKEGVAKHCLLCGEFGVGKSELINSALKRTAKVDIIRIELKLYEADLKYSFLIKLIDALNRTDYDIDSDLSNHIKVGYLLEKVIKKNVKENKHTIIYVKNLQYADAESLYLIKENILSRKNCAYMFIMEFTETFNADFEKHFFIKAINDNISIFNVKLLSKTDVEDYFWHIKNSNINISNQNVYLDDIFSNSLGNLMFVKNEIHDKCKVIGDFDENFGIKSKIDEFFYSLNNKEKIIMKILFICDRGIEISILQKLTQFEYYDLISTINSLIARKVVVERAEVNFIVINLKYRTLKKFIGNYVNNFELQATHEKCARIIEEHYGADTDSYYVKNELFYHYKNINNVNKELYYEVSLIKDRLDYLDQFFPSIEYMKEIPKEVNTGKGEIFIYLDDLYKRLYKAKDIFNEYIFEKLESELIFLMGRTLIRQGKGDKGIEYIYKLMENSTAKMDRYFLYKSYLEIILYSMRKSDFETMSGFLDKAFLLNQDNFNEANEGELLRLSGLYNLLIGNYDESVCKLHKSIEIFEKYNLREKNAIQIAAAHSYLGEIYRKKERYDLSEKNHKKAINICLTNGINKPLDCFYQSYGYMLFCANRMSEAKKVLLDSLNIYDMYGTHWLRSIAESCLGLIALINGEKNDALLYFRKAEIFSWKYKTAEEIVVLDKLREKLKQKNIL